jgi:hypothetical protein
MRVRFPPPPPTTFWILDLGIGIETPTLDVGVFVFGASSNLEFQI